jgi:small redox-active disulfide protein 2
MKKIEILGTGCPKCKKLYEQTLLAVGQMGIAAEVVKVEDIQAIIAKGVMMTPGLVVDGEVKSVGRIPPLDDLKRMIG